jgi:Amt family ammonium transporter
LCNGVLAGLVSVTAGCAHIQLWAAAVIGFIGGFIFYFSRTIFYRYEIDDPLEVTEIHAICGIWSLIAMGIFDVKEGLVYTGNAYFLGI